MPLTLSALILSTLVPSSLSHAAAPPELRPVLETFQFPTAEQCFPSGLKVIYQQDPALPLVEIQALVEGGARADAPGAEGGAHLLEHLWFRSRPTGALTVSQTLEDVGASYNAYTERDLTRYVTLVPREHAAAALRLEGQRLRDPLAGVSEELVGIERRVLEAERATRALGRAVREGVSADLYPPEHPYARLDERPEGLARLDLPALRVLAGRGGPASTTLVLVGGLDVDVMSRLVEESLPPALLAAPPEGPRACAPRPLSTQAPPAPPRPGTLRELSAPTLLPVVGVAWTLPAATGADTLRLELLGGMVEGFLEGRRDMRASADPEKDASVSCQVQAGRLSSELLCSWAIREDEDPAASLQQAVGRIDLLWSPSYRSSLERSLEYMRRAGVAATLESLDLAAGGGGRVDTLADAAHTTGRLTVLSDRTDLLARLEIGELLELGRTLVRAERAARFVVRPTTAQALAPAGEALALDWGAGSARVSTRPLSVDPLAPDLSRILDRRLDNGMRVVVLPVGEAPLIWSQVWFPTGPAQEPLPGLDALTRGSLDLFPDDAQVGEDLSREPYKILSRWTRSDDQRGRGLGITGPSGNLEQEIWLLSRVMTRMEPDGGRRKSTLERSAAQLALTWRLGEQVARAEAFSLLFGEHSLAKASARRSVRELESAGFSAVQRWAERVYQPANATLIIVGRVDPERAFSLAKTWFADWTVKAAPLGPAAPPPEPPARQVRLVDAPGALTRVTLRCQGGPSSPADTEVRALLVGTWERIAGQSLRDERGAAYLVQGGHGSWAGGASLLSLETSVEPAAAGIAARTLLELPALTREGRLPPEAIDRARRALAGAWLAQRSSGPGVMSLLTDALAHGQRWAELAERGARLQRLGAADLQAQVGACAGHEVLTLVGPRAETSAALDAAGLSFGVVGED